MVQNGLEPFGGPHDILERNVHSSISCQIDSKITEEELKIWIEENFPTLSRNEILEICK